MSLKQYMASEFLVKSVFLFPMEPNRRLKFIYENFFQQKILFLNNLFLLFKKKWKKALGHPDWTY